MVTPEAAIEAAQQGLRRLSVADQPGMIEAMATGHPGDPVYVARLDQPGHGYYLVPWLQLRGITLIVVIDAQTGMLSSVAHQATPQSNLVLSLEELRLRIAEQSSLQMTGEPTLVWQPCRETASPFLPLYMVPTNNGTIFVGMNGALHHQLTPFMKGGA